MSFDEYVENLKRKIKVDKKDIRIVCIGTSQVLWDSIGPLVGTYLKEKIGKEFVFGDTEKNICSKWDLMENYYKLRNKFIIAIDTAIVPKSFKEQIFITDSPIVMGLAFAKNKGVVGNLSIKVAISDLDFISLEYVNKIAKFVGEGIFFSLGPFLSEKFSAGTVSL